MIYGKATLMVAFLFIMKQHTIPYGIVKNINLIGNRSESNFNH